MKRRSLLVGGLFWLLVGLACAVPAGFPSLTGDPTVAPDATATTAPATTPTLAPTVEGGAEPASGGPATPTLAPANGNGAGEGTPPGGGGAGAEEGANGGAGSAEAGDEGGGEESSGSSGAACAASGNLLVNGSFESPYVKFGGVDEINHAQGWIPWFNEQGDNLRPEYKPADGALFPNRVVAGQFAQQYFKSFGVFRAGLFQIVQDVPAGCPLQFSVYAQAWSCQPESGGCPGDTSVNPANMFMRIGIHPDGNAEDATDPLSGGITWSSYFNPIDAWQQVSVSAVAQSELVVVFLWASPDQPRLNQDVYWDEASLVVQP
jgi:hypothetical protein